MMTLEQLFEGNQTHRGVLGRFENNKKVAWIEPKPFDWEKHLKGEQPQGLSPVNTETAECRWLCLDIDLKIKPDEFCKNIYEKIYCKSTELNKNNNNSKKTQKSFGIHENQ